MTTTYSNKSNARRAAKKALDKAPEGSTITVWQSTAGWNFRVEEPAPVIADPEAAPVQQGRSGGREFMSGRHVRRSNYGIETVGSKIFQICDFLQKKMGLIVPYRQHVVELAKVLGIKETSARAGYTHYKQVRELNHRAGRPTAEEQAKFEKLVQQFK